MAISFMGRRGSLAPLNWRCDLPGRTRRNCGGLFAIGWPGFPLAKRCAGLGCSKSVRRGFFHVIWWFKLLFVKLMVVVARRKSASFFSHVRAFRADKLQC